MCRVFYTALANRPIGKVVPYLPVVYYNVNDN